MEKLLNNRYQIVSVQQKNYLTGKSTLIATDTKLNEQVIMKCFSFGVENAQWQQYKEIDNEISALRLLKHTSIPRYLADFTFEKSFYLVQELIGGTELSTQRHYSESEVIAIAKQLLDTLAYLESLNPPLIHHDIKPQNILVDHNNKVYLVDFGIAQNNQGLTLNFTTQFSGTEGFVAPERFTGRQADSRSDLYSLGITLACLMSQTQPSKVLELINDDFELRINLKQKYSPKLANWINKLVRRKPQNRFSSAIEAKLSLVNLGIEIINPISKNVGSQILPNTAEKKYLTGRLVKYNKRTFFYDSRHDLHYLLLQDNQEYIDKKLYSKKIANRFNTAKIYGVGVTDLPESILFKDKNINKGINFIRREYLYPELVELAVPERNKAYVEQVCQKLNQINKRTLSVTWLSDRAQRIAELDQEHSLWKLYLNPSLCPTLPLTLLIDLSDSIKPVWTVPPDTYTMTKALNWRKGYRQSTMQKAYNLIKQIVF